MTKRFHATSRGKSLAGRWLLAAMMVAASSPLVLAAPADILATPRTATRKCGFEGIAAMGLRESAVCRKCHVFDVGKPSPRTGPNLSGTFGRPAANSADFRNYSKGLTIARAKGIVWDEQTLDAYIKDPHPFLQKLTGNTDIQHNMFFKLGDGRKRTAIIAYMKALRYCQK